MGAINYEEFVKSKLKTGEAIMEQMTPTKCHIMHMAIGIVGEVIEYCQAVDNDDEENAKEELGDLMFHIKGLRLEFPTVVPCEPGNRDVLELSGLLLDRIKKHVVFNKSLDEPLKGHTHELKYEISHLLSELEHMVTEEADGWGVPIKELQAANVAKLDVRYKNGYSDRAADERADKKEGE